MKLSVYSATRLAAIVAAAFTLTGAPTKAQAGTNPFLGEIMMVGFNFCPRGWANADGQLLPISQNSALFSLYGTTYGGDGRTTFALPDLRGRVPMHEGDGPGLTPRALGERGGQEQVTLNTNEMPSHNHAAFATVGNTDGFADKRGPANKFLGTPNVLEDATTDNDVLIYKDLPSTNPTIQMDSRMIGNTGGGQAHANMQPYLVIRFCVATTGTYPSRN